jgi:hypothetical protein
MSSKEVLTLQFGNYSNHVGTHFWNTQYDILRAESNAEDNEISHTKLFRETSDCRQDLFPRMVTFGSKQSLRTLKLDGTFDMTTNLSVNDNGPQSKISKMNSSLLDDDTECVAYEQMTIEKNDFLVNYHAKLNPDDKEFQIEDKVKSWTDYMSYTLNENSLQLLRNRFEDDKMFTYHGLGCTEYNTLMYDIEDKLHYWIEECNSLDGFMLLTDIHDGFSGLMSKVLEELHEEYRNKTVLPFANLVHTYNLVESGTVDPIPWLNVALSLQSFHDFSTMFVMQGCHSESMTNKVQEITMPNLLYKTDVDYHSSAILASAIDTATLPWRRRQGGMDMFQQCKQLTQDRFKMASCSIGYPLLKHSDGSTFFDHVISSRPLLYDNLVTSLFPLGTRTLKPSPLTQSVVMENLCDAIVPALEPKVLRSLGLNYDIFGGSMYDFMDHFIERSYPTSSCVSDLFCAQHRRSSFPQPLSSMLNDCEGSSHNAVGSLFTSSTFHGPLRDVITQMESLNVNKYHHVKESGHDTDTHKQLIEDLYTLTQEYDLDDPFKEHYDVH